MKKIGFIDHSIDNFHANKFLSLIRSGPLKEKYDVACAWEEEAAAGKRDIDQWCGEMNVEKAESIEQVVAECDGLMVLSPDRSDRHEDLADLPLRSGKPVCVDKTFAPSLAAAKRMFEKAEQHGTPLMSSSVLRFGSAFVKAVEENLAGKKARFAAARGAGASFAIYAVHQLEMLVAILGTGASRVMQCGNDEAEVLLVDYPDGRRGVVNRMVGWHPFQISFTYGGESASVDTIDDHYDRFVDALLDFFETGNSPVPKEETLEIMALVATGVQALEQPGQWLAVAR